MFFWHRLGIPFYRILVPTWPQVTSQLAAKIHQKSVQEPSKIHPNFHLVIDFVFYDLFIAFYRFLFKFPPREFQIARVQLVFICFFDLSCFQNKVHVRHHSSVKWPQPSFIFGKVLGSKLGAKIQKRPILTCITKMMMFVIGFMLPWNRILMDFGSSLAPKTASWIGAVVQDRFLTALCQTNRPEPHFGSHFNANLTPTYLPTWCQNPPKDDPRAIPNPSQLPSSHRSCVLSLAEFAKRLESLNTR